MRRHPGQIGEVGSGAVHAHPRMVIHHHRPADAQPDALPDIVLRRNAGEVLTRSDGDRGILNDLIGQRRRLDLEQHVAGLREVVIELHVDRELQGGGFPFWKEGRRDRRYCSVTISSPPSWRP